MPPGEWRRNTTGRARSAARARAPDKRGLPPARGADDSTMRYGRVEALCLDLMDPLKFSSKAGSRIEVRSGLR